VQLAVDRLLRAWAQHMTEAHPDKKATTRPLPQICSCSGTDDLSAQELYDHAVSEHMDLLYSFPGRQGSAGKCE
jgi:hypothetical protein